MSRIAPATNATPRVAVIGAGVVGTATARSLALGGAQVVLYERTAIGAGTSTASFAWVNSHIKEPAAYHDLNSAGILEHHVLHAAKGPGLDWFYPTGNLEWAEDPDGDRTLEKAVDRLTGRGYPAVWLTPRQACDLVPDLRVPAAVNRVAYFPMEGHALPHLLLSRLWGEARDHGAQLRFPAEVTELLPAANGRVLLHATDGSAETFDVAVTAVGRWTGSVTAAAGLPVPMADPDLPGSATVGFLGFTGPVPTRLDRVLITPRLNVRPDGGGRLVIQSLQLDAAADPGNPPATNGPIARALLDHLTELLHGAAGARLESLRVGQRALPADGLTVAGFLPTETPVYTLATHSGITLGPLLGRLAAEEILSSRRSPLLDRFAPDRLTSADPAAFELLSPARLPGNQ
ncbi:MAG TPA: FAD-dependent oxidoreductase [Pseudonocardiaceae bacterium]|nr:FAD-dependent oxidoreductase [Pseudonocardiaceae bacterium]